MVSCQRAWTLAYVSVSVSVRERGSMLSKEKKGTTYRTRFYLWMRTKLRKRSAVVFVSIIRNRGETEG